MLPLILFGAAYLIGRTTKETTEFADGGMMAKGGINVGDNVIFLKDLFVTQETDEYDSERGAGGKTLKIVKVDEFNNVYYLKEAGDYYKYIIGFKKLQGWIDEKYVKIKKSMADGGMMAKGGEIEEGDVVIVKSENLKAEVTNVGTDFITVEFIGKRPEGGDKRGTYKKSDLKKYKK